MDADIKGGAQPIIFIKFYHKCFLPKLALRCSLKQLSQIVIPFVTGKRRPRDEGRILLLFITAGPITKLFAWGEEDSEYGYRPINRTPVRMRTSFDRVAFGIPVRMRTNTFLALHGHAPMGDAVSMSERSQGFSQWREGVGVGVGHICTQGSMQSALRFHPMLLCCQTVCPWFWGKNAYQTQLRLVLPWTI